MNEYDPKNIEKKWQDTWEEEGLHKVEDNAPGKDNYYALVEFSYPSGNLHVGHWYAFAVPDIFARFKRMKGFNVLYPMGFDAFGLPAENAAIKYGGDPKTWTYTQMDVMRQQLRSMGASFDWEREVVSCDPEYYKWTQWMFNQFLKHDLVYRDSTTVNWCPKDQTVLANEQVHNGCCERCGSEVEQKKQDQWMIRITNYADRLIDDLEKLDWPEEIKSSQKSWIGRSEGSEISFTLKEAEMLDVNTGPGGDAYREGEPVVERENVVVIIENPSGEDFLCARWKKVDWQGFVTGGIEEGKTAEETALEEVREETGYQNVKLVKVYDQSSHGLFWHVIKNENRKAHYRIVHVKLENMDREEPSDEEKEIAEFVWVSKGEVNSFLKREDMGYPWRVVTGEDTLGVADVFTTRADTLFGVTYIVLAPEHPLVVTLRDRIQNWGDVESYIDQTKKKSELDRQQSKEKTGVELKGVTAINPANGEQVPVWVADYVLAGYGTGAVMAVPAHDERDFEFAKKFGLEIKQVVALEFDEKIKDGDERLRPSAYGLIKNDENQFLLQKTPVIDYLTGEVTKWEYRLPGGGLDKGETFLEGLIREISEEVGYKFTGTPGNHWLAFRHFRSIYGKKKGEQYLSKKMAFLINLSDCEKCEASPEDEEANFEYKWFTKEEAIGEVTTNTFFTEDAWLIKQLLNPVAIGTKGLLVNSGEFDGLTSEEAQIKITEKVGGKLVKTYRLRDWGISRQRYWGCPIPIVYDPEGVAHAVPDEHLPWLLPEDVDHTPDGTAPLARSEELKKRTEEIFGKGWRPEVETMDTFVDSTWYFYRYLDNKNDSLFASSEKMKSWMPIDLYMGGAEHTTMHLLYSRFWTKALFDMGLVKEDEAFKVRLNRGLILGPDGNKMSKSKGNVINPDEVVDRLGADTVRMYLCFMGPYGVTVNYPWDPNGVVGVRRFLERVWRVKDILGEGNSEDETLIHQTTEGVTKDIEKFKFNTAISKMMVLVNSWEKSKTVSRKDYCTLLNLLSPFAPHMTEELWRGALGEKESIHLSDWPTFDPEKIKTDTVEMVFQVNGKVRAKLEVAVGLSEQEVMALAKENEQVQKWLTGEPKKVIYVKDKLLNIVV